MNLSSDLISQLVKATKTDTKPKSETTLFGTVVYDGRPYVKIDGSDLLTPVSTTTDVNDGERVTVMIKNHAAIVTGNISSPAARTDDVKEIGSHITEFEIVIADKVSTEELEAEQARIDTLVSENVTIKEKLTATEADISELEADNVTINEKLTANEAAIGNLETTKLDAEIAEITYATIESLEATNADIYNLRATYGTFVDLTTDHFEAVDASIVALEAEKLSATDADLKYANIDFTNISKATMEWFYAQSGLIKDVVVGDGTITGELVGVTIKGDLIEGNTVKADKLVVKGSDGIYYKLNFEAGTFKEGEAVPDDGLHGSVIVANTITAEKINVDDLVAFEADIGGLHIADGSIYSGVKDSATNTTRGVYLGSDGQVAFGDSSNYLKYYKDQNGQYRLEISAASLVFGASSKPIEEAVSDLVEESVGDIVVESMKELEVGGRNKIRNSATLLFDSYYFSGPLIHVNDGLGALEITCGANCTTDENGTCAIHTMALDAHDGLGTVILNDNYSGITAVLGRGIIGTMIIGKET